MESDSFPDHSVQSIRFSVYTDEEIKKLSVKEVTSTEAFDSLNHPTYGGLHDPALGPNDLHDICQTCNLSSGNCPGHMGHINVPLPVYNPVLFRTLVGLVKLMCLSCHQLRVPTGRKILFTKQIKAIDLGLIGVVEQLGEVFNELVQDHGTEKIPAEEIKSHLSDCLEKATKDLDLKEAEKNSHVRHVVEVRSQLLQNFLRDNRFTATKNCPYCKAPPRPISSQYQATIYITKSVSRRQAIRYLQAKKERGEVSEGNGDFEDVVMEEGTENTENESPLPEQMELQVKEKKVADVDYEIELQNVMGSSLTYLNPEDIRGLFRKVWTQDSALLSAILGVLKFNSSSHPTDIFFLTVVPVTPPVFRPALRIANMQTLHGQTKALKLVLESKITLQAVLKEMQNVNSDKGGQSVPSKEVEEVLKKLSGSSLAEKLNSAWLQLQTKVNAVVDSDLDKLNFDAKEGVKQLLEKKEGLFRQNMMGKRVNYAARSVITPDPYIATNEIGIPEVFAHKLTYPQPVTPWNFHEMKQAVINGPLVRPGATKIVYEDGVSVMLKPHDKTQREAIAKQLLTPSNNPQKHIYPCKLVCRHLRNGDVLLLNRQPTLHRPSIQAHKARILPREKTLRLHYANCKAYNADFDGDEMNAHFPQDEISRSEAYNIVSTDKNYLVPKDGTPLAGLIQDHMVSGVHLTLRGRFFNRHDYHELVFRGLTDKEGTVKTLPPCVIKPHRLWSGKQVVSTVLLNIIPDGKQLLSLYGKSKVAVKDWQNIDVPADIVSALDLEELGESEVVIRQGELLQGVLDKGHYGNTPYGLVHCCYELYGGAVSGQLLTCLARLFTSFLQMQGFTLGVEDILATRKADKERRKILRAVPKCEKKVYKDALHIENVEDAKELEHKLREAQFHDDGNALKDIDLCMKGQTDEFQNTISKVVMPVGLQKRFPHNNLQLMVQSGAKGSVVNCVQISCLLGQIELEGRRPPLMISGQTLPSFLPYDLSPRAGGFVGGRFLTGIRPQEYFFHCMAGREGLIDTAVKTSRSGYLQRCIIKHLEGLTVNYDLTVRDSDNSVIQFQYGEDGLEIQKTQFLKEKQFPFLIGNKDVFTSSGHLGEVQEKLNSKKAPKLQKKLKKQRKKQKKRGNSRSSAFLNFCNEHWEEVAKTQSAFDLTSNGRSNAVSTLCDKWSQLSDEEKQSFVNHKGGLPDPITSVISQSNHFGAVTERMDSLIENYINNNPDGLIEADEDTDQDSRGQILEKNFRNLLYLRNLQALVEPGEAVGLTAAQSIGEPSTQMTLNTFHFAGRGEMNVTLGIPRLREILMVASANIKTPTMDIPLLATPQALKNGQKMKLELTRVMLNDVLEKVTVNEVFRIKSKMDTSREFKMRFQFLPHELYENDLIVNPSRVLNYMETKFFSLLTHNIHRRMAELESMSMVSTGKVVQKAGVGAAAKAVDEDVEDDDQHDDDATATKQRQKQMEDVDYEGEDEEREEVGDEKDEDGEEVVDEDMEEAAGLQESEEQGEVEKDTKVCLASTPKATPKASRRKSQRVQGLSKEMRINSVLSSVAKNYSYDVEEELWCEITMEFPLQSKQVDLPSLINSLARRSVIYEVPNIKRCFLSESKKPGEEGIWRIKTEGINLQEIMKYADILDLNKLYTNDIHAIANQYGLEAAGRALVQEVRDVFAGYGIVVDYRHLSLIADYMTFEGSYKPLNRTGLEFNASPLQKMTFETTMRFLKQATVEGASDDLKSPSARLVMGGLVSVGGGVFDLLQPLK